MVCDAVTILHSRIPRRLSRASNAYVRYDADSGKFRLYDSGSQRGTSIFRGGRRLEVPRGPTRGAQLQSGTRSVLGRRGSGST